MAEITTKIACGQEFMLHVYVRALMNIHYMWILFAAVVSAAFFVDLVILNRRHSEVSAKESLLWSAFWIGLAILFGIAVYFWRGEQTALEFFTGYLIEESLSVDNLFVFLMIFGYFAVPPAYQRKALLWGIIGVVIIRAIFIFTGVALIERLHWIIYVFGAFLVLTGIKMALEKDKKLEPEKNPILKLFRKFVPVTHHFEGDKFFVRHAGKIMATPLFVVVLVIETTDILFAVDSIPAVLAITQDPFVVYTSNIFAVLGLRALFFTLSGMMVKFHLLNYGLAAILAFVGIKMLLTDIYKLPISVALGTIAALLTLSILASMIWPKRA